MIKSPYFSKRHRLDKMHVGDTTVAPVSSVRNLGAMFDSTSPLKNTYALFAELSHIISGI